MPIRGSVGLAMAMMQGATTELRVPTGAPLSFKPPSGAGDEPGAAPAGNTKVHVGAPTADNAATATTAVPVKDECPTQAAKAEDDGAATKCATEAVTAEDHGAADADGAATKAAHGEDVATHAEDADGAAAEDLNVSDYGANDEDHHDAAADYNDKDDAVAQDDDEAVIDCNEAAAQTHDAAVADNDDDAVAPFVATERVCMGLDAGPPAGFERCGAVDSNAISKPLTAVQKIALGRAWAARNQPPRRACPSPPKESNGRRFQRRRRSWQEDADRQAKRPRAAGNPQPPQEPLPLPMAPAALSKASPPQRIAQPQPSATSAAPMPGTYAVPADCEVMRQWMRRLNTECNLLYNMIDTHFSHIRDVQLYMLGRMEAYEICERHATHLG
jgi:hypothetical protein